MSFGTAQRGTGHIMGTGGGAYTPVWRVTAACVVAKGQDGRNQHCYGGDTLDWLSDEQAAHFLRCNLVERIDADAQDVTQIESSAVM
jgi:hypothetical protein